MGLRGYANPQLNEITFIVQIVITVLAFIFNVLLVVIVQRSARKEIGNYRSLITFFALSDVYYNCVHFLVYPIPENFGNAYFLRGHGVYTEYVGIAIYAGAYAHTFPILIFHFLYRLLAIKYPHFLQNFTYFLLALVGATVTCNAIFCSTSYWFFYPDDEALLVLTPVLTGSIPLPISHSIDTAAAHQIALSEISFHAGDTFHGPRWRNLAGTGIVSCIMCTAYTAILFCCHQINKHLKETITSNQSIRLHKQLFRSLVYQSFVPLLTAYFPAGSAMLLPIFGLAVLPISIIVPPICATHPLVDPLLLMLTITEYRRAFFSLIGLSKLTRAANAPKTASRSG